LGDVANLPTAKTAAGAFSEAPVVVHNLLKVIEAKEKDKKDPVVLNAHYDGYSSCPMFVGGKKLMMIEFKYDNLPAETFYNGQTKPNHSFYLMKKHIFPRVFFNLMPRGRWYGRKTIFHPKFN